ncbi:MAG: phosphoribosyltransferase [Gammaproteobacteria bacterium]|nr:phosphoribosyltransferase [Gammaproteobacteria bacterium]MBU1980311.1 phosphoribosyltransferase [Gammaproteobacteria bacterium]
MDKQPGQRTCLYDTADLDAVLTDMARQTAGLLTGRQQIAIVGLLRRGAPLAEMLRDRLARDYSLIGLPLYKLHVKRYADDLTLLHPETELTESDEQATLDLTNTTVLVVDDVLYRGHSLLKAVEYLAGKNPLEIRTLVLVDRGVTRLPIRADITGMRLDVAPQNIIECNVPPYEPDFRIDLLQPDKA